MRPEYGTGDVGAPPPSFMKSAAGESTHDSGTIICGPSMVRTRRTNVAGALGSSSSPASPSAAFLRRLGSCFFRRRLIVSACLRQPSRQT